MIGLADKRVHKRKQKVEGRFAYHERLLPFIAVHFKSYDQRSSLDDAVMVTREAVGNEHPDPSPGGVLVSAPTVAGDDEGD